MRDQPTRVVVIQFPHWTSFAASLGQGARSAFEPVVRAVVAHVPLVEVTAPGIIVFATRGPSRFVGGDQPLAQLMRTTINTAINSVIDTSPHSTYGIGIGDGRLSAAIAAHQSVQKGQSIVVSPSDSQRWLAAAPVRSMIECIDVIGAVGAGVPHTRDVASYRDVVSLLERLGLYRFGDVVALREADLIARFGAFGRDLGRLARGLDRHPPLTTPPPPDRVCTRQFDAPVESRDAVVATVDELAVGLTDHLAAHGLLVVRLHVLIESDHGERSERMWYRADGFTARAIVESVRWQLDAWIQHDAPTSGVTAVRLSPEQLMVNSGRQSALWGGERDGDRQAQHAIRRVAEVNGAESVTVPTWRGDRDPARTFELVRSDAVDFERRVGISASAVGGSVGGDFVAVDWRGAVPSPAPALVFDTIAALSAPTIRVLDSHGELVVVDARHAMSGEPVSVHIDGVVYDVTAWAGPWPVEERWWDPRRARRVVRLQLVIREHRSVAVRAMIAVLERRVWRVAAWYA